MRSQAWLESLTDDERRASVFGLCYEKVRREHGQWGYKLWPERSNVIVATKALRTCITVVNWLDASGFEVTWREVHWQGYVKFAFAYMAPTTPMIGQLKNKKLLALYIQSAPEKEIEDVISQAELLDLYRAALDPEVAKNGAWMSALGLREP